MMIQSVTTSLYERAFAGTTPAVSTVSQASPAVENSQKILQTLAENPGNQRQAALALIVSSLQSRPEPVEVSPESYQTSMPEAVPGAVTTSYAQSASVGYTLDLRG